jgi:hypothetical protein
MDTLIARFITACTVRGLDSACVGQVGLPAFDLGDCMA